MTEVIDADIESPAANDAPSSGTTKGVIVIGAGSAGLTAAYDLKRKKIPVQVLEANPTTFGGRMKKLEGFAEFPIDLGAEWVHMPPKILRTIIDDPSVNMNDVTTKRYQFAPYSEWRRGGWALKYATADEDEYLWKFVDSTWHDFFGTFLVPTIQDDIYYGCVVSNIEYSGEGVTVTCQDGRVFQGDQVIVTVALPILQQKRIQFHPPLPDAKQDAIDNVPCEPGFKAFLEFSEKFYFKCFGIHKKHKRRHGEMYFYDESDLHSKSSKSDQKRNVLAVFCYGDLAQAYVNKTDAEILQSLLQELDEGYKGRATRTYMKGHVQNWTTEEHVGGTYSSYRNGMKPMFTILQPLDNKVFFAGEHLPVDGRNYGYVTGAAFSGRSAAQSVMCVREGTKPPYPWRVWFISTFLGTLCCGLEHWLFFHDLLD